MTTGIQSKGVDLDSIFDPYVTGASPGLTGIQSAGTDIHTRYAPLVYGTQASATGIACKVGGAGSFVDLNTLFAAKGTATYALPINGNTYQNTYQVPSGTGWSGIGFTIASGNTYQVYGFSSASGATVIVSGPVPSGAVTVKYTWGAYTIPAGATDASGSTTNAASSATAISSNPSATYQTATVGSTSATRARNYPFTIDFFNSAGTNISHTVINLEAFVEGSV